jgi:Kef-type K+ transport system membrane component KefB
MIDLNDKNTEEKVENSNAELFYGSVSKSTSKTQERKMTIGVLAVGLALGIVTYFTAAAVSGSIALMVWGLLGSFWAYFLINYGLHLAITLTMIYFFQKMIYSWTDSNKQRRIFIISSFGIYIIAFIFFLIR